MSFFKNSRNFIIKGDGNIVRDLASKSPPLFPNIFKGARNFTVGDEHFDSRGVPRQGKTQDPNVTTNNVQEGVARRVNEMKQNLEMMHEKLDRKLQFAARKVEKAERRVEKAKRRVKENSEWPDVFIDNISGLPPVNNNPPAPNFRSITVTQREHPLNNESLQAQIQSEMAFHHYDNIRNVHRKVNRVQVNDTVTFQESLELWEYY
ncbi:hypothetical protein BDQ17DRAFT_1431714 [Cyathus striatus]|nr:hypothetical protein BDQ17DRAFT_1431714 [Cyathus striatus]